MLTQDPILLFQNLQILLQLRDFLIFSLPYPLYQFYNLFVFLRDGEP